MVRVRVKVRVRLRVRVRLTCDFSIGSHIAKCLLVFACPVMRQGTSLVRPIKSGALGAIVGR